MRLLRHLAVLALVPALWPWSSAQAGVGIGVGVGFGYRPYGCYRPYYGGYRPYAPVVVGVGVGPVLVAPTPVYQPVTVVQPVYAAAQPVYSAAQPAPAPAGPLQAEPVPSPTPGPAPVPASPTSARGVAPEQNAEIDRCLQRLGNADDRSRVEAMIELGRLRASQAVEPLKQALAGDRSPVVREAAARSLGLIAAPSSLPALQLAAQADDDREVRSSARFAADVIRSNLRRQ